MGQQKTNFGVTSQAQTVIVKIKRVVGEEQDVEDQEMLHMNLTAVA